MNLVYADYLYCICDVCIGIGKKKYMVFDSAIYGGSVNCTEIGSG